MAVNLKETGSVPAEGNSTFTENFLPTIMLHGFTAKNIDRASAIEAQNANAEYNAAKADQEKYNIYNSDIADSINISKFVITCNWQNVSIPPYANATITMVMPSELANFIFHGEVITRPSLSVDTEYIRGGRHIQAGGWFTISMPDSSKQQVKQVPGNAVFFGKILDIQMNTHRNESGALVTSVILTGSSWIYPFTLAETRKTPIKKTGELLKVDNAAIDTYSLDANNSVMGQLMSIIKGGTPAEALKTAIQTLGYFHLPTSIEGLADANGLPLRLGDHVTVLGNYTLEDYISEGSEDKQLIIFDKDLKGTPYEKRLGAPDVISGQLMPFIAVQNIAAGINNVWQFITSVFQAGSDLIELFPILLPLNDRMSDEVKKNPLAKAIGAIPFIVYRYKPLPPDVELTKETLVKLYTERYGNTMPDADLIPLAEKFFATKKTQITQAKEASIDKELAEDVYLDIHPSRIVAQELNWSDTNRKNACNFISALQNQNASEHNLFGHGCTPVFNAIDINRHGLRMQNSQVPFMDNTSLDFDVMSSAHAERWYYTYGEGHAYASGKITLTYTHSSDLVCGLWAKIDYNKRSKNKQGVEVFSEEAIRGSTLTFYITGVSHSIAINPQTGQPTGVTELLIERASYGNRIPFIKLKNTPSSDKPNVETNAERRIRNTPNRKG